jgi:hypothetical protein
MGWIPAAAAGPAEGAVREEVLAAAASVLSRPAPGAPVVEPLARGSRIGVLGEFSGYLWVRAPGGQAGWLASATVARAVATDQ